MSTLRTTSNASNPSERRRFPRIRTDIGAKILRPAVARYISAITEDVSQGGALLTVRTTRPVANGEDLSIGVCWARGPLLKADELVTATVVRAEPLLDGAQRIAVRFARVQQQAADLSNSQASAA